MSCSSQYTILCVLARCICSMYLFCVLKLISNMIQASHNANLKIGESFPWAGPGPRPLQKHAAGTLQPHPKHTSYWFRKPGKGARCICSMYWLDAFALWFNSWAEKIMSRKIMSRRHENLRESQIVEPGSVCWIFVLDLCAEFVRLLCVLTLCTGSMHLLYVLVLCTESDQ